MKCSPALIIYLHDRIVKKFNEEYRKKHKKAFSGTESQFYGEYNPAKSTNQDSLKKFICESQDEKVINALREKAKTDKNGIQKRYLYKRRENAENWLARLGYLDTNLKRRTPDLKEGKSQISFLDSNMNVFLAYIGEESLDALVAKEKEAHQYYVGFYLSLRYFKVKNNILKISKYKLSNQKHLVEFIGFHSREGAPAEGKYFGTAFFEGKWLHANLQGHYYEIGRRINLMGGVTSVEQGGDFSFKDKYIRTSIQATTTNQDRLFNGEMFLVAVTEDQINKHEASPEDLCGPVKNSILEEEGNAFAIISLYLTLHRNTHAFRSDVVSDLANLQAKGNRVRDFTKIVGYYRIWNFNSQNDLVQSGFEIEADGLAYLTPFISEPQEGKKRVGDKTLEKHIAFPEINTMHLDSPKIIVVTFGKGMNLINVAIFEAPAPGKETLKGVFSSLMYETKKIITKYIVMRKENAPVVPSKLVGDTARVFAEDNNLLEFYEDLYKLHYQTPS